MQYECIWRGRGLYGISTLTKRKNSAKEGKSTGGSHALKRRRGPKQIPVRSWTAPRFRYRRYFGIRVFWQSNITRVIKSLTVRRNAIIASQRRQNARIVYIFFLTRLVRHDIYNRGEVKFQNREKICILIRGDKKSDRYFILDFFYFHSLICFSRCNHVNGTTKSKRVHN